MQTCSSSAECHAASRHVHGDMQFATRDEAHISRKHAQHTMHPLLRVATAAPRAAQLHAIVPTGYCCPRCIHSHACVVSTRDDFCVSNACACYSMPWRCRNCATLCAKTRSRRLRCSSTPATSASKCTARRRHRTACRGLAHICAGTRPHLRQDRSLCATTVLRPSHPERCRLHCVPH